MFGNPIHGYLPFVSGNPPDVIEAALAHVDKNEVRRAYNRSDYLEQLRPLMQWWADFVKAADRGSLLEGDCVFVR
ncbi:hypothetical protein J5067_14465 [Candidatus Symbiopectobacterium sp. NZEC151]|nr:hypothetical protein [Candidatus Symbiopectobacterium sp. NZEC151]MCW2486013.1 hypothetical protein [Candidatus Symbiopectobacterium sp. NZEC127]